MATLADPNIDVHPPAPPRADACRRARGRAGKSRFRHDFHRPHGLDRLDRRARLARRHARPAPADHARSGGGGAALRAGDLRGAQGLPPRRRQRSRCSAPRPTPRRFNASAAAPGDARAARGRCSSKRCRQLVAADRDWFPTVEGGSLYLRPFMFATEAFLGVRPAKQYKFLVIASPAGNYFKSGAPAVSIWVSDYTRAAPGGTGAAKCGGNYAASLVPAGRSDRARPRPGRVPRRRRAQWIEELGGMNLFFVFDDGTLVTPPLTGTILPGITRDSLITLAREEGLTVREERYSDRPVARRRRIGPAGRMLRLRHRGGGHPGRPGRRARRRVHHRQRRPRPAHPEAARTGWSRSSAATRPTRTAG